eukprot:scaffold856_cov326-Pavlova_lutheri.AAC.14
MALVSRRHSVAVMARTSALCAHRSSNGAPPSTPADQQKRLHRACAAVRLASRLCADAQRRLDPEDAAAKGDASPVTVADYAAQAIVSHALREEDGSLPIMVAEEAADELRRSSEEARRLRSRVAALVNETLAAFPDTKDQNLSEEEVMDAIDAGAAAGGPKGAFWVLDPIDGTRGFVGMRQYSVCLARLQDGKLEMGVLGCPNLPARALEDGDGDEDAALHDQGELGCLFAAMKGWGTRVGPLFHGDVVPDGPPLLLSTSTKADLSPRFMESFETRHSRHEVSAAVARKLGVERPSLKLDSQCKYGALARGDAPMFMRFPPKGYKEKIWDHAAGTIIVEEAGGTVSDARGNALDFSQGRFLEVEEGIIAAIPQMHQKLVDAVQSVLLK